MQKAIKINEFWILKQLGPRLFSATATKENRLCFPEHRTYYSREAFEHEWGSEIFNNSTVN